MRLRRAIRVFSISIVAALLTGAAITGVPREAAAGTAAAGTAAAGTAAAGTAAALAADPSARAAATGKRVEVQTGRSETRQIFAEPDGTFTMELSAQPERVQRGEEWVPVDATLHRQTDGTVSPKAVSVPVVFSGGGASLPLVRATVSGEHIELRWPGNLPVPTLAGDTATYAEVLPGVDLRLQARPQGFGKVFVVKTPQAAKDPRLARIGFGLTTGRLAAGVQDHGGLSLKDTAGNLVLESSGVQMWDSGSRRATGRALLSPGRLELVPDEKFLHDPQATFPVMIDPDFAPPGAGWVKVFSGKPDNAYHNGGGGDDGLVKVGYCGWDGCNGIGTARSFIQFNISALRGAQILGAEFNMHEVYAPSCSARPFRVYSTYPVGAGTTWNAQPGGWVGPIGEPNVAYGYSASCPQNWVGVNAGPTVSRRLSEGSDYATFAMVASNESDAYGWKKFDTGRLVVTYNWLPDAPGGRWANAGNGPSVGCPAERDVAFTYSARPTLHATPSDRDGQNLAVEFEWWNYGGSAAAGRVITAAQPNKTAHAATIPAGVFQNGSRISWRARARDSIGSWGPYSAFCQITVDTVAPGRPSVTSTDYPQDQIGGYAGKTGVFTVRSADADILGYQWSLNFQDLPVVNLNSPHFVRAAPDGSATIRATPVSNGPQDLYVRAVDKALNVSQVYQKPNGSGGFVPGGYHFLVGSDVPAPAGQWPIDGFTTDAAVPDHSGRGRHATTSGTKSWVPGRSGDALDFDGVSGHAATSGPVLNTSATFSVAAWARLDTLGGYPSVLSQDGVHRAGFQLQANLDNKWAFAMFSADAPASEGLHYRITSPQTVRRGVWTHLAATYDAATRQMQLYVDGRLAASGTGPAGWNANGPFTIGRSKWNGAPVDFFPGAIDSAVAHSRLLTLAEIQALAGTPAVERAFYPLEEAQGDRINDASGNYQTGTMTGATWAAAPGDGFAAQFAGAGAITTTAQAVATDSSFTITARALLDSANSVTQTVVSQDGPSSSGLSLQYRGDTKKWSFAVSSTDGAAPVYLRADSAAPAVAGQWVHLAGVYDMAKGEIRLYVNGVEHVGSGRPAAGVAGNLVIGRGKLAGAAGAYFTGRVDDVHVYAGVVGKEQIVAEVWQMPYVTSRPTVYTGQLTRYVDHTGRNFSTSGPVPQGYHFVGSLGMMAPPGTPGTHMLYSCKYNGGQFTSRDAACEGETLLSEIGLLYSSVPAGVPVKPIYRCVVAGSGDHFIMHTTDCLGHRYEGLMGYSLAYRHVIRFVKGFAPHDHLTGVSIPPQGYRPEGSQGIMAMTTEAGTRPVYACVEGADEFLSHDSLCEGKTARFWIGNVWLEPPAFAEASTLLYNCTTGTDRFTSLDPACEGRTVVGPLGYVIIDLPGVAE